MKKIALIIVILMVYLASCTKKKVPVDEQILGLDYYPLTQGKFVVYDVDSIIFTDLPKDTIIYKYRIKEKIADSFIDNEGKSARRIERYIKKYDPAKTYDEIPWTMKEVWMVNADNKTIQVSEGNIRYTKLAFPIREKESWNGNAYNSQGERIYVIDYIDRKENIQGNDLAKVLLVKQFEYPTLISHQYHVEKYAKNIGLVYKEITDVLSNTIVPNKTVLERIESGIIYKQTLVTYGYE